jgi:putative tryptophan/tyrosine transport system substrate-binding protein
MTTRREFIRVVGGAAAGWPLLARAQQSERMRRIGALLSFAENDRTGQSWLSAFRQGLEALGWNEGSNTQIMYRFTAGDPERMKRFAVELAELRPDVILVAGTAVVGVAARLLTSIPVVFVQVTDPVGTGLIASLARPGGNMTGFTSYEYSFGGKWLEQLREMLPSMTRVAILEHADNTNRWGYLHAIETAAYRLNVAVIAPDVRQETDFDSVFARIAREPSTGLIVPPDPFTLSRRAAIIALARRHRLPSVYAFPLFVTDGGLMSFGIDNKNMYRRSASYVDQVLRGEKPGELPVQPSSKFELIVNLKASKEIGLTVPPAVVMRADEVIAV